MLSMALRNIMDPIQNSIRPRIKLTLLSRRVSDDVLHLANERRAIGVVIVARMRNVMSLQDQAASHATAFPAIATETRQRQRVVAREQVGELHVWSQRHLHAVVAGL